MRLPPSDRDFLFAGYGWRDIDLELEELLKIDEIGWFPEKEPELLSWWSEIEDVAMSVKRCLLLSGRTDCAVYWLLNPTEIGPDGEWAAHEWATGDGCNPERYPSFGALVMNAGDAFNRCKAQGFRQK